MPRQLTKSRRMFERAQETIAGGVSSDARRMAGTPLFVDRAVGSRLWDVDGNEYVDFVLGQGPAILGHAPQVLADAVGAQMQRGITYSAQHELESVVAERLCRMVPGAELVRFNSVGSEAAHAAIRLARGHTGRSKVLKFEGHYHGWLDPVLFSVHPPVDQAGDAAAPELVPGTRGQVRALQEDLLLATWNDIELLERAFDDHGSELAAVIMEPILCNTGAIVPEAGYLERARELCDEHGAILIFDEVITGFRAAPGGAAEALGVTPDLGVYGKAMAGGMQVSALAGRREVMSSIANGSVAHAGTFNSHPVAIAAAAAVLRILDEERDEIYPRMTRMGEALQTGIVDRARDLGLPMIAQGPGPMFQLHFTEQPAVRNYREFVATDRGRMAAFHSALLDEGVSMVPRGLWFLSAAHDDEDVAVTLDAVERALSAVR